MAKLHHEPIPHEAGRDLVRGKIPVTRAVFDRMLPELRTRAFMVTGIECANVLQRVRDLTAELPVGGDFKELKGKIFDEISPWLITDMDPEEAAKQRADAARRAELLLRMHGWQAYAQTQHEEILEMIDVFPFSKYASSEDTRVRATHAALNGKIFPSDHSFWHNHTPPWEPGCRCDKVPMMADEVDEIRAAEAGKPLEDRNVMEGAALQEVEQGNLVVPGGTGKLDIRTPREKKGSGYEWRPDDRNLDLQAVLDRYDPTVRETFTSWAKGERLEDGRSVWEAFGGKPDGSAPPPVLPVPAPVPAPGKPVRKSPVSAALDVKSRNKQVKHALRIIDELHDDGVLPRIPVSGRVSSTAYGHYSFDTFSRRPLNIGVAAKGDHPALTAAHEIGHFLDHQAMGQAGVFQSDVPGSRVAGIVARLRETPTFGRIHHEAGGVKSVRYYESSREVWARAYAQYIAEESGDPLLIGQLDAIRGGFASYRQWPAEEFAPVREAMRKLFSDLGWNPKLPEPMKKQKP